MQIENSWIGEDISIYQEWLIYKQDILDNLENNNIDISAELIYKFLWNVLCDIWIEKSKNNSISLTLNQIISEFEPIFNIYYK